MAANSYKCGELFWRFHLQNRQNADEVNNAGDNFNVESGDRLISESNWSFTCNNDSEARNSFIGTNENV